MFISFSSAPVGQGQIHGLEGHQDMANHPLPVEVGHGIASHGVHQFADVKGHQVIWIVGVLLGMAKKDLI